MKFCLSQSPSKSFWRHTQWGLFILLVNWTMPGTSLAQTYPDKPIKFVVSFTAGGTTDILAREVANQLTQRWKVPVVVENKAGAAGNLGTEIVGRAAPDGYTLLVNSFGPIAINPTLFKNLNVNPQTELQPIALIAEVPTVLVVPTTMGINTMAEFMAFAKANAGNINYGSTGIGTAAHMTGYLYSLRTNINATHIPYKGGGEALSAVVAGNVDLLITATPTAIGHVQGGRVRALAVTGTQRSPAFADVPTLKEAGLPNYLVMNWYGLGAPKGTSTQTLDQIYQTTVRALADPGMQSRFAQQGVEPLSMTGSAFSTFIKAETIRWTAISQAAGLTPE